MKLVAVEQVPEVKKYHKLQEMLKQFADSNAEVVKIDFDDGEYKSLDVARNVLGVAVKNSKRPIRVMKRGNDIYLAKIK